MRSCLTQIEDLNDKDVKLEMYFKDRGFNDIWCTKSCQRRTMYEDPSKSNKGSVAQAPKMVYKGPMVGKDVRCHITTFYWYSLVDCVNMQCYCFATSMYLHLSSPLRYLVLYTIFLVQTMLSC